jgi:hypothetical protein
MAIEGEEKLLTLDEALRSALPPLLALLEGPVAATDWAALDPSQRRPPARRRPGPSQVILAARIDRLATAPGAAGVRVW